MPCPFHEKLKGKAEDSNARQETQRTKKNLLEVNIGPIRMLATFHHGTRDRSRNAEDVNDVSRERHLFAEGCCSAARRHWF